MFLKLRIKNKKAFIYIDIKDPKTGKKLNELEPSKRAKIIKAGNVSKPVTSKTAKLNSIKLAELILGSSETATLAVDSTSKNNIINSINKLGVNIKTAVYAILLALNMNSESKKAKEAINSSDFAEVNDSEAIAALKKLSATNIIPKGKISSADADALVAKLLAALAGGEDK